MHFEKHVPLRNRIPQGMMFFIFQFFHFLYKLKILNGHGSWSIFGAFLSNFTLWRNLMKKAISSDIVFWGNCDHIKHQLLSVWCKKITHMFNSSQINDLCTNRTFRYSIMTEKSQILIKKSEKITIFLALVQLILILIFILLIWIWFSSN